MCHPTKQFVARPARVGGPVRWGHRTAPVCDVCVIYVGVYVVARSPLGPRREAAAGGRGGAGEGVAAHTSRGTPEKKGLKAVYSYTQYTHITRKQSSGSNMKLELSYVRT